MSADELRNKIVKLAQAYRTERIRNEEFERALKSANIDLANAKQMQTEYENVQHAFSEKVSIKAVTPAGQETCGDQA